VAPHVTIIIIIIIIFLHNSRSISFLPSFFAAILLSISISPFPPNEQQRFVLAASWRRCHLAPPV